MGFSGVPSAREHGPAFMHDAATGPGTGAEPRPCVARFPFRVSGFKRAVKAEAEGKWTGAREGRIGF